MGRPPVQKVQPRGRRRLADAFVILIGAIVLALVIVGIVSSARWVSGRVNAGSSAPRAHTRSTPVVAPVLARAHAQATAIVRTAEDDAHSRAQRIDHRAKAKAKLIVEGAKKQARAARQRAAQASPPTPVPAVPAQAPAVVAPSVPTVAPIQLPVGAGSAPPVGPAPNFAKVPKSWLVVAYGANLSAFTVNVTNRSSKTFSGRVTITYLGSQGQTVGSASATFSGLAGHTTAVLPLQGSPYPANAVTYRVGVSDVT